ncbi:MAG TPA: glycosyltransferase family 39 protein, partial [Candidatus Acidoferrum sp.]|nr:glycosyltransferase family 39 protein [Candidatus Acidoferrum sp.]
MRQVSSATIESSPRTESSIRESLSRQPLILFAVIFVVAAFAYSFRLGNDPLGATEAYSAWAAAKPGVGAIVRTPVPHDPGKQVLYYVVLHYYTLIFGLSEISLRSMSVIFSLMTLTLVFALGREMFDDNTALAAAAMWAFNPLAMVFAHTARMYPMLVALALAQLLMLQQVRSRPSIKGGIGCGILGAALPYTHLTGLLILGAEGAILLRDLVHGKRATVAWMAIVLAIVLFIPYLPIAIRQSQDLMYGHSLDYLGPSHGYPLGAKVAAGLVATGLCWWLIFGRAVEPGAGEPIRLLAAWIGLPALAFVAGSVILHPMFNLRYLSPEIAAASLLIAGGVALVSVKWRNLLAAGFALVCL